MPQVKDAPMLLVGHVASVEARLTFEANPQTPKKPDGLRVLISSADGFAVVKVREDIKDTVAPQIGQRVAWVVRPMFWEGEQGSGMAVGFVRLVDHADIDFVGSAMLQRETGAVPA